MLTHEINTIHNQGISVIVLNAVENAIERYGHAHRGFISNAYEWFSLKLGYKNSKFLYRVFQQRRDAKLGYREIMVILSLYTLYMQFNSFFDLAIVFRLVILNDTIVSIEVD